MGLLQSLQGRGLVKQITDPALEEALEHPPLVAYCGVDPTGSSLHVGHLVPFLLLRHLQRAGHRVIVVVGGGTAQIGDPSGKTETRKLLDLPTIQANAARIAEQLKRFLVLDGEQGWLVDNAEWLSDLRYLTFLRDIGRHFSVNRMLSFETYRDRLETGLSFLEFNYLLLQSYDYLILHDRFGCRLQVGGDDQWGNIVSGIDLIRRLRGVETFGLTVPLLVRSDGKKMGKTEKGSVFLDPQLTPPFEFYQYWRNLPDADVEPLLRLFTELPLEEIRDLTVYRDERINRAKEVLAWQVTALVHGQQEADRCLGAARAAFSGEGDFSAMPRFIVSAQDWERGLPCLELYVSSGLCSSKGEARRLVEQGGALINDHRIRDVTEAIGAQLGLTPPFILKAGKKRRVLLEVQQDN